MVQVLLHLRDDSLPDEFGKNFLISTTIDIDPAGFDKIVEAIIVACIAEGIPSEEIPATVNKTLKALVSVIEKKSRRKVVSPSRKQDSRASATKKTLR